MIIHDVMYKLATWIGLKGVQNGLLLVNKKMSPVTYFCPCALLPGTQRFTQFLDKESLTQTKSIDSLNE